MEVAVVDAAANTTSSWLADRLSNNSSTTAEAHPHNELRHVAVSIRLVVTFIIMVGAALIGLLVAKLLKCYLARAPLPENDVSSEMSEHTVQLLRLQRAPRRLSEQEKASWRGVVLDMWRRRPSKIDLDELHGHSALRQLHSAWRGGKEEVAQETDSNRDLESGWLEQRQQSLAVRAKRLGAAWLAASRQLSKLPEEEEDDGALVEMASVSGEPTHQTADETAEEPTIPGLEEIPAERARNSSDAALTADAAAEPIPTPDDAETVEVDAHGIGAVPCAVM